jgi:hypothetical protein
MVVRYTPSRTVIDVAVVVLLLLLLLKRFYMNSAAV